MVCLPALLRQQADEGAVERGLPGLRPQFGRGAGADYLGIGPFRFTTTKKNLSPVLGLEGYSSILSQMKEANIEIPVVAIGGITYEDIPAILHTGVNGIALSGTILGADNPIEETRRILNHA
jgi:thiamine-phosphate pyrophosphorylase